MDLQPAPFNCGGRTYGGIFVHGFKRIYLYLWCGKPVVKSPGYLKNRIYRVYPLWVVLVCFGAFTTIAKIDFSTLIEALLPIVLHSAAMPWTPFTAMHWSLVIEFQFYLNFPLLMAASQKIGMVRLVLSMVLLRLLATPFGADSLNVVHYSIATGSVPQE